MTERAYDGRLVIEYACQTYTDLLANEIASGFDRLSHFNLSASPFEFSYRKPVDFLIVASELIESAYEP